MLTEWVNCFLDLDEENEYKPGTVRNWLHICRFSLSESKKGVYIDGHERADVVKVS